jgi:hypothetical protein
LPVFIDQLNLQNLQDAIEGFVPIPPEDQLYTAVLQKRYGNSPHTAGKGDASAAMWQFSKLVFIIIDLVWRCWHKKYTFEI